MHNSAWCFCDRIKELTRLEETFEFIESKLWPNTTLSTRPRHCQEFLPNTQPNLPLGELELGWKTQAPSMTETKEAKEKISGKPIPGEGRLTCSACPHGQNPSAPAPPGALELPRSCPWCQSLLVLAKTELQGQSNTEFQLAVCAEFLFAGSGMPRYYLLPVCMVEEHWVLFYL